MMKPPYLLPLSCLDQANNNIMTWQFGNRRHKLNLIFSVLNGPPVLWLHICSCIVFCCVISLIPVVTEFTKAVFAFLCIRPCGREDSINSGCFSKMTTLPHHPNVSITPHLVQSVIFLLEVSEGLIELSEESCAICFGVIVNLIFLSCRSWFKL